MEESGWYTRVYGKLRMLEHMDHRESMLYVNSWDLENSIETYMCSGVPGFPYTGYTLFKACA